MGPPQQPYYRHDLALVHHLGFGFHADMCAPGILKFLEPVRDRGGQILEIGCGSGALTRYLVEAGHRVHATDASPAMLEIARDNVPGATNISRLTLPDDPLPAADAIVSIGHPLSYLPDEGSIHRALVSMAGALRPEALLAVDICDLEWGRARAEQPPLGRVGDDWAIVTRFSLPSPDRYVRELTTFVREPDGSWRRDDERHDNVLIDTSLLPELLATQGVEAEVREAFGTEKLPAGLVAVVGRRRSA